jgi:glycosyltransferase involved in cell wall biosynthesis
MEISARKNYMEKYQKLSSDKPRVSIGMPVFASTDYTQQICREYATKDSRIHYYCNEKNLGAPRNFNRVFELSSGEYFKWAAYDDVLDPKYLQKCVSVLDKDPSIVLCHSRTGVIDENGILVGNCDHRTLTRISSWKTHERFGDLISIRNPCWAVFGEVTSERTETCWRN